MEEQSIKLLSISELVHQCRPLTGAYSLSSSNQKPKLHRFDEKHDQSSASTNPKTLKPLNYPTVLVGTLNLPVHKNLTMSTSNSGLVCSKISCFSFSDDSSSICCDILEFDPRVIGKKINVLAWNYIPFKCGGGGGFLEIIKWDFVESSSLLIPCSSKLDSFPLSLEFSGNSKENCSARYYVHGVIESVSPVTVVPCSVGIKDDKGPSVVCGFLAKVLFCDCDLCSSRDSARALRCISERHSIDNFTKSVTVYFYDFASCWHPVISRLVGNYVSLTGLKKKLIFIGKEDSQLMFVTSEKSSLHLPRLRNKCDIFKNTYVLGNGECGEYTGVVTEIYMQGMVIELDEKLVLLLTDQLLSFTHSLRVGAIVSVRNVHFVNPKFSWTKVLILGACFKTTIHLKSFSPLKAGSNIHQLSESLLRKFIDSLSFSAKMWALLTISCLKKKFSGILSEKDILGSKHKQGVAQKYCTSCLPSSVIRSRHGIFTEYCKHDSSGCGSEPYCGNLKLVVPISSFISHCEAMWMNKMTRKTDWNSLRICGRISYSQPTKRILQSKDIDVVLLGSLKNSVSSGSWQLTDATSSIDIIIPDLPSAWSISSIYQLYDFTVVIEGISDQADLSKSIPTELYSCRNVFNNAISVEERKLVIYLYCHLKNEIYRSRPFCPNICWMENLKDLSARFHMLSVTHKFPVLRKFQGDHITTNRFSIFAEAIILPWDLLLLEKNRDHRTALSDSRFCGSMEHDATSYENKAKRCKSIKTMNSNSSDAGNESACNSNYCPNVNRKTYKENIRLDSSHPIEIPCIVAARTETLFNCKKDNAQITSSFHSGVRKVLLEFESDSFCSYQSLNIGGYYIIKHNEEDIFCTANYSNDVSGSKIVITSRTSLLSISFLSHEALLENDQTPFIYDTSFSSTIPLYDHSDRLEPQRLNFINRSPQYCSDIKIYLSPESLSFLKGSLNISEQIFAKPIVSFEELNNISERTARSTQTLQTPNQDVFLPIGSLISLHAHVVDFHSGDHSPLSVSSGHMSLNGEYVPHFFKGVTESDCIHVLVENHMVRIVGVQSKHALPVGFGAGVDATFHRILVTGRKNELLLIPASVIVITSASLVKKQYESNNDISPTTIDFHNIPLMETGPVSLISEINECLDHLLLQVRCKIISVYVLVLEKNKKVVQSHPITYSRSPVVDIPLAGFIIDDGSSLCCCWTDNEKALTLLRLDNGDMIGTQRSSRRSKKTWLTNSRISNIHKVNKILQQHGRVVMRNFGSTSDSSCQDIIVSAGSNINISSSDEEFLKFIILDACFSSTRWAVVGCVMDSDATKRLENQLMLLDMRNLPLRNIWCMNVNQTNPVTEARSIVEELNMMSVT